MRAVASSSALSLLIQAIKYKGAESLIVKWLSPFVSLESVTVKPVIFSVIALSNIFV